MGPPFLAFYGLVTQNQSLLQEAYDQVKLRFKLFKNIVPLLTLTRSQRFY